MALRKGSAGEIEEYHSLFGDEPDDGEDVAESERLEPPVHPVRSMQSAFEESIVESTNDNDASRSSMYASAEVRRQKLLESEQYDDSWSARWQQKPTARYHPLLKLMAQIVFGMHLLEQQQAKSEEEVVKILQMHVNEVDTFLERTSEDFDLAISDIEERIRFLKLPMVHQDVFEIMLDDRKFRTQLLDGNDKIEKIIDRTTRAMNASLLDIQKSMEANRELGRYLDGVQDRWPKDKRAIADVFGAMRGNEHGWTRYLKDLQVKGINLGRNLIQLGTLLSEMSRLAATATKRNKTGNKATSSGQSKSTPSSPGLRSKFSDEAQPPLPSPPRKAKSNLNKRLPKEPPVTENGAASGMSKPHPIPFAERYERPRQSPRSPAAGVPQMAARPNRDPDPPRPKTAGARLTPREARPADARDNTAELAQFLKSSNPLQKHQNPLRSNPPDELLLTNGMTGAEKKLSRSQSQGANLMLNVTPPVNDVKAGMARSRSQGALDILRGAGRARTTTSSNEQGNKSVGPSFDRTGLLSSTGFARRLSKRMKHIPVPEEPSPEAESEGVKKAEPPSDSAYSSGSDKKLRTPESKAEGGKSRPESTLGPLPVKMQEPGHSARASNNQNLRQDGAMSVRSLASTSKSRSLSIRKIFHRSFRGGKMTAA